MNWVYSQPFPDIVSLISYSIFVSFAAFIVLTNPRQRTSILASFGMITVAIYILSMIFTNSAATPEAYIFWLKAFWIFSGLPSVAWLHLTLLLRVEGKSSDWSQIPKYDGSVNRARWTLSSVRYFFMGIPIVERAGVLLSYLAALILGILGTQGEWLFRFSQIRPTDLPLSKWTPFTTPVGELYGAFSVLVGGTMLWSSINLGIAWLKARDRTARQKYNLLLSGSLMFTVAAIIIVLLNWLGLELPEAVGHIFLAIGMSLVGYSIARYNAFLEGRVVDSALLANSATYFPFLAILILIFLRVQPEPSMPALTLLVSFYTLSYIFKERIVGLWESRLMPPLVNKVRTVLQETEETVVTIDPNTITNLRERVDKLTDIERLVFDKFINAGGEN